mgnify:CR=1 FL=1
MDLTSGEFAAYKVTTVFTNNSGVRTATIASAGGGLTLSDGDELIVTLFLLFKVILVILVPKV